MLFNTLPILGSLAALANVAVATPLPPDGHHSCGGSRPKPTLPVNGGGKELDGPGDLKLKYVTLGFGIQNYTCSEEGADPKATGALASLYDITHLYPGQSPQSLDYETFVNLGVDAIFNHDVPLNLDSDSAGEEGVLHPGASLTDPFLPAAPLTLDSCGSISLIGHHFFNAESVPTFLVNEINFLAKKNEEIPAPSSANPGVEGTGTVGWLNLGASEGTKGASRVYRVSTVGGSSHGCSAAGDDSTSYTAQYWFYG